MDEPAPREDSPGYRLRCDEEQRRSVLRGDDGGRTAMPRPAGAGHRPAQCAIGQVSRRVLDPSPSCNSLRRSILANFVPPCRLRRCAGQLRRQRPSDLGRPTTTSDVSRPCPCLPIYRATSGPTRMGPDAATPHARVPSPLSRRTKVAALWCSVSRRGRIEGFLGMMTSIGCEGAAASKGIRPDQPPVTGGSRPSN